MFPTQLRITISQIFHIYPMEMPPNSVNFPSNVATFAWVELKWHYTVGPWSLQPIAASSSPDVIDTPPLSPNLAHDPSKISIDEFSRAARKPD